MSTQAIIRAGSGTFYPSKSNAHTHKNTQALVHSSTHAQKGIRTDRNLEQREAQNPSHKPRPERESGTYQQGDSMPYFMLDIVRGDQDDRVSAGIGPRDYGKRWKATFRSITGDAPVCGPRDHDRALEYWRKLRTAVDRGGWSPSEWGSLVRSELIWRKRAHGLDPRFEVVGTRAGRVTVEDKRQIQVLEFTLQLAGLKRGFKGRAIR